MNENSHYYVFLKTSDWTYDRRWVTPREARNVARTMSWDTGCDVLVFRMQGAVRVRYEYEVSR